MKVIATCANEGCSGTIEHDLGPHRPTGERQVVPAQCSECGEIYTLTTNLNTLPAR